jgi:hypothetical protein
LSSSMRSMHRLELTVSLNYTLCKNTSKVRSKNKIKEVQITKLKCQMKSKIQMIKETI